jgi:phage terminase large subunit-like protein
MTTPDLETWTNSAASLRARWTQLLPGERDELLAALAPPDVLLWSNDFPAYAHEHQMPPAFTCAGHPWTTWLILGGRGAGKTRAGAEWVRRTAEIMAKSPGKSTGRIALVGESEHDVREVMIEGVSGVLTVHPRPERPIWIPSRRRLEWRSGVVAEAFSAEDPESLRGPQFSAAWADELAKWRHADATFDMLQFGLRLGERPRQVITTTPRPIALLKRLIADPATALTHASTRDNAPHLSAAFIDTVFARYGGTRIGRQELDGEIIAERADALWTRALLESCRVGAAPALQRIVVAVDPPASTSKRADACGLVAAGRAEDGTLYVIADETVSALSPAGWAQKAIALWHRLEADALVVEVNQGGDMVRAVIGEADRGVPVVAVRATRTKYLRAEPVAALYEQGRVKHAGMFPALEDELCDFGLDGLSSGRSPDRLDALVWALTSLSFGARSGPRVRGL